MGASALMVAILGGKKKIMTELLKNGADTSMTDKVRKYERNSTVHDTRRGL
jgi:hypothetical protein